MNNFSCILHMRRKITSVDEEKHLPNTQKKTPFKQKQLMVDVQQEILFSFKQPFQRKMLSSFFPS